MMNMIKKIVHYLLNVIFILGWLGFYLKSAHSIIVYYIPGTFRILPKTADINIYVSLVWQIVILVCYNKLFVAYFKQFFLERIGIKSKTIIILKCVWWMLLMGLTYLMLRYLSCALDINHIEDAFWYNPK